MNTGVMGTRRPRDVFVRFGMGTSALRRQGRVGRTLPLLVRHERVCDRDVRSGLHRDDDEDDEFEGLLAD